MTALRTSAIALAAALALPVILTACSSPINQSPNDAVTARELQAVSDLKTRYKDVVTGTEVQGRTLVVYIDVDNMYSMDEDAEAAMKAQELVEWKRVWSAAHPHQHAVLHLTLRDYYGKEIYASSTHA